MLDTKLLEILACPKCKGELDYRADEQDNSKGKLICKQCKLIYSVERDIPNMLIDQATSSGAETVTDDASED
jgi:uncharacterized protein YbaR (Trm112 family)